jgi:hypothetical protein
MHDGHGCGPRRQAFDRSIKLDSVRKKAAVRNSGVAEIPHQIDRVRRQMTGDVAMHHARFCKIA